MTTNEIYTALKNTDDTKLQNLYQILSSNNSTVIGNYLKSNNDQNDPLTVFAHAIICDEITSSRNSYYLDHSIKGTYLIFCTKNINGLNYDTVLNNLPTEFWKYLPNKQKNKVQKIKQDNDRKAATKDVKLDLFSFTVYKTHLEYSKGLSGALAVEQLAKLFSQTVYNTKENRELTAKYIKLIWDHTKVKSLALCKELTYSNFRIINKLPLELLPFQTIMPHKDTVESILNQTEFSENVAIPLQFYQRVAREYNIPVHQDFFTDRYSEHHLWITGVPKPSSKLLDFQLIVILSCINVLNYILDKLQKTSTCRYFIQAREQLVAEVSKQEYLDKTRVYIETSIQACRSSVDQYSVILTNLPTKKADENESV